MSKKDEEQPKKSKESDISKGWADIDDSGSVETVDEPEPLTVIATTSPYEDFDDTAESDGEVDSPQPDREERRRERAKRRQGTETTAESGESTGRQAASNDALPGNQQTKKGGKESSEGDGKPGSSKK